MHEVVTALYDAINARDADRLAGCLAPGADWPDAMGGGRVVGRDVVRRYWLGQWAAVDLAVHPRLVRERPDGRYEALVDQTIRDRDGDLLSETVVAHTFTVVDGLVARMDVGDPMI